MSVNSLSLFQSGSCMLNGSDIAIAANAPLEIEPSYCDLISFFFLLNECHCTSSVIDFFFNHFASTLRQAQKYR